MAKTLFKTHDVTKIDCNVVNGHLTFQRALDLHRNPGAVGAEVSYGAGEYKIDTVH